jgi:hypothetical protein
MHRNHQRISKKYLQVLRFLPEQTVHHLKEWGQKRNSTSFYGSRATPSPPQGFFVIKTTKE